jgi:3'5'-cyclic nucleotide phosphodiesterase
LDVLSPEDESTILSTIRKPKPIDEVRRVIEFPAFREADFDMAVNDKQPQNNIVIDTEVVDQLNNFIACIAAMYRIHEFHNFEHASRAAMSTSRLLSSCQSLIDPLTQFACTFSSLIPDVDHPGVSNNDVVSSKSFLAQSYGNSSAIEQNAFDLVWSLLMSPVYYRLRTSIYRNKEEFIRFRQIMVNTVIVSNVDNLDHQIERIAKWKTSISRPVATDTSEVRNLKLTCVIEIAAQASAIVHSLQHWSMYQKWIINLLKERYDSFSAGRLKSNPYKTCFETELAFLDTVAVPLSHLLKESGCFGASVIENMDQAMDNRNEWERGGQDVVAEIFNDTLRLQALL